MKNLFKFILTALILCIICSSCNKTELEIETISTLVGTTPGGETGENIQLKYNDIIYSAFAMALGGYQKTLDVPCGDKIGILKEYKHIKVFEVKDYNPDEWLYVVFNSGNTVLYKADSVTDIPEQFNELLQVDLQQ